MPKPPARPGQIPRVPVSSSNVRSIGYDEPSRGMDVEFHSGAVYHYAGVPPVEHTTVMSSPSIGKALNERVKSRYPAVKIKG